MKKDATGQEGRFSPERRGLVRLGAGLALSALVAGRLILSLPFRGSRPGPVRVSRACADKVNLVSSHTSPRF